MTRKIKMHNTAKTISAIERTDMIIKGTNLLGFVLESLLNSSKKYSLLDSFYCFPLDGLFAFEQRDGDVKEAAAL